MRWQNWNLKKKAAVLAHFQFLSRLSSEWRKTIAYKSNEDGKDLNWNTKPVHSEQKTTFFIHYVVWLLFIVCGRFLSRCVYNDIFTRNETKEKWNKKYFSYIRRLVVGCCSGNVLHLHSVLSKIGAPGAQLVEALRYKTEGRGFDSRWCHWNFSLT